MPVPGARAVAGTGQQGSEPDLVPQAVPGKNQPQGVPGKNQPQAVPGQNQRLMSERLTASEQSSDLLAA